MSNANYKINLLQAARSAILTKKYPLYKIHRIISAILLAMDDVDVKRMRAGCMAGKEGGSAVPANNQLDLACLTTTTKLTLSKPGKKLGESRFFSG